MKRRSFITTVAAACAAGMLRVQSLLEPNNALAKEAGSGPPPSTKKARRKAGEFDERLFGEGVPVETTNAGVDWVLIDGEMIGLAPVQELYEDLDPDAEVILTENGLRVIDRNADLVSNEPPYEQTWIDPDDGQVKTFKDLPKGFSLGNNTVTFWRGTQKYRVPLTIRKRAVK